MSLGIACTTKAALGNSPVSSIPYTLSLIIPRLTLGNWTILFNLIFVVMQAFLIGRKVNKAELLIQTVLTFVFGYCVDLCMWILKWVVPGAYWQHILVLIIGCFIMAFGVWLEVLGDVAMLPADAVARVIASKSGWQFGSVRLVFDISCSLIAAALCIIFLGKLSGVREGTVICALLIGNIVKFYTRRFQGLSERIFPEEE